MRSIVDTTVDTALTAQYYLGVMEKSRAIGAREICSPELVRAPALRHACLKGSEPSHKSKMEDLTVEVCGENGAYYKVRSVKSIQKSERRPRAVDRPSYEPRCGRNLAEWEPVLCECTALKGSRDNAASFDAMSRLTGRDFPLARVVAHLRTRCHRRFVNILSDISNSRYADL